MQSILDPKFHYVPAINTNLRKLFARERKRIAEAAARVAKETEAAKKVADDAAKAEEVELAAKVRPMKKARV